MALAEGSSNSLGEATFIECIFKALKGKWCSRKSLESIVSSIPNAQGGIDGKDTKSLCLAKFSV